MSLKIKSYQSQVTIASIGMQDTLCFVGFPLRRGKGRKGKGRGPGRSLYLSRFFYMLDYTLVFLDSCLGGISI